MVFSGKTAPGLPGMQLIRSSDHSLGGAHDTVTVGQDPGDACAAVSDLGPRSVSVFLLQERVPTPRPGVRGGGHRLRDPGCAHPPTSPCSVGVVGVAGDTCKCAAQHLAPGDPRSRRPFLGGQLPSQQARAHELGAAACPAASHGGESARCDACLPERCRVGVLEAIPCTHSHTVTPSESHFRPKRKQHLLLGVSRRERQSYHVLWKHQTPGPWDAES